MLLAFCNVLETWFLEMWFFVIVFVSEAWKVGMQRNEERNLMIDCIPKVLHDTCNEQ